MKRIIALIIFNSSYLILNCFAQQPGWDTLSVGVWGNLNSVHFIDQYDLYICGEELLNFTSTDSGMTWQVNQYTSPVTLNDIFVIDQNIIVAVGNSGTILRTTDGGNNWATVTSGVTDDLLSVSFVDSFGICGALSQTILYSSNSGASWNIAQSGFFGGGFWGAKMLSGDIGFVAGENSIFQPLLGMTTDAGVNWDFHAFYLNGSEGKATGVDFTDMFTGYVCAGTFDLYGAIAKTTDSGINWVTTLFPDPLFDIDFPISNTGLVGYAVGDAGVILKTFNAGDNWLQQQSGTNLKLNKVHFIDLDYGIAVGENGIILRTTTGGEPVTSVNKENESVESFQLFQNYPNPFNPSTKVKFTIPASPKSSPKERTLVRLIVYDILGKQLIVLVNEEKEPGIYEVNFDGSSLSSGVYFYILTAGINIEIKKMVLLR
jgi:photosystem II stability/assembly factor-like uncharacterized protein